MGADEGEAEADLSKPRSPSRRPVRLLRSAADPSRPLVQWIALVGLLVGIVAGLVGLLQPDRGDTATPGISIQDYLRTDGSLPQRVPRELGMLSFGPGAPLDEVREVLGEEDVRRLDQKGRTFHGWDVPPVSFWVTSDDADAVKDLGVTAFGASRADLAQLRLALPNELILGQSTMGDVLDRLGGPAECILTTAEGEVYYDLVYLIGSERSWEVTYTYITSAELDPGGFNSLLYESKMTVYSVKPIDVTTPAPPSEVSLPCFA